MNDVMCRFFSLIKCEGSYKTTKWLINAVERYCQIRYSISVLCRTWSLMINLNIFLITQEYLELKLLPERLSMIYHNIEEL